MEPLVETMLPGGRRAAESGDSDSIMRPAPDAECSGLRDHCLSDAEGRNPRTV